MFYTFIQNNSGGSFIFDEDSGITHFVIVEADSSEEANSIAERIGLYWNGCDEGVDCPCCGDRWDSTYPSDGCDTPMIYSSPVKDFNPIFYWMDVGKEVAIHYKDGSIKWYGKEEE